MNSRGAGSAAGDGESLGAAVGSTAVPDGMPVLSEGKHRRPRHGGCFMEFASFLAGERWSDHPDCTHPLLASLARFVNDSMSDDARSRLVPLIPSVVGLDADDAHLDALVARRCAMTALPAAPRGKQRALAVALLTSERLLARLDGDEFDGLTPEAGEALARVPQAHAWAVEFAEGQVPSTKSFCKVAGPTAVRCAIEGLVATGPPDLDDVLHGLLADVIRDCRAWLDHDPAPVAPARWAEARALQVG